MQYITTAILITEMGVSNEAKSVIPLKFLRKIKKKFFSLANSIAMCAEFSSSVSRTTNACESFHSHLHLLISTYKCYCKIRSANRKEKLKN
jgi:hypothetical protein